MKAEDLQLKAASYVLGRPIHSMKELSDAQMEFFSSIDQDALAVFFAKQEALEGETLRKIARKYGMSCTRVWRTLKN